MDEYLKISTRIRFRELPADWNEDEYRRWWLPLRNASGRIISAARMSEREKERWTAWEGHNLLTTAGRTALLSYMGTNAGGAFVPFASQLSIGSTTIVAVYAGDTAVVGEYFRKQPTTTTITGNTQDVSTFLATTDANGTFTNLGLYGTTAATGTLGSGTLYSHSLVIPNYVKTNASSLTIDYSLSLN